MICIGHYYCITPKEYYDCVYYNMQQKSRFKPGQEILSPSYNKKSRFQEKTASSRKETREATVFQLEGGKEYSQIIAPILQKDKRDIIQSKLELQRIARENAIDRIKGNQLFVPFTYNPFTKEGSPFNSLGTSSIDDGKPSQQMNLIDAVNQIKRQWKLDSNKSHLATMRNDYSSLSNHIQNNIQSLKKNNNKSNINDISHQNLGKQLSFESILAIQQQSYNFFPKINIFRIPKGNLPLSSTEFLSMHFFTINPSGNNYPKYPISCYKHISTTSRKIIIKNSLPSQQQAELPSPAETNINLTDIGFQNIVGVASGRLTPKMVDQSINNAQEAVFSDGSSEYFQDQINYEDNSKNFSNNFQGYNHDRQEIALYEILQLSKGDRKAIQKFVQMHQSIQSDLHLKSQIIRTRINDKKLHKQFDKQINNNLHFMVGEKSNQDISRIISKSKVYKDRVTTQKNLILLQSIRAKKNNDDSIRQYLLGK